MLEKYMKNIIILTVSLFLFGCVATGTQQTTINETGGETAVNKTLPKEKNPCDILLDEIVVKSRNSLKTVIESCQGLRMEVNPMWDMDYDGSVHIRIYDAEGNMIRDEIKKPVPPQEKTD